MSTDKPQAPASHEKDAKEITAEIEHTRAQMSETLGALEQRLSPAELGGKARVELDQLETRVKGAVTEVLQEAKGVLDERLQAAKGAIHEELVEAKGFVTEQLESAKGMLHGEIVVAREAVNEQLDHAKEIVTRGLSDARATLKHDISAAIDNTKQSVRDATLGRVENIATQTGDFMNTTRDTLVDTVRQNPIPAALAGIGIAWLLMNRSTSSRQREMRSTGNPNYGGNAGNSPNAGWSRAGYDGYIAMPGATYGGPRSQADYGYATGPQGGNYPNGRGMDDLRSGIGQAVSGFGDSVGRAVSGAQHAVSDAAGAVAHRASDAGAAVSDAVTGAAHNASEAARNAASQGMHAASNLVDATGRIVHNVSDATGRIAHQAADATGHLMHDAAGAAGHLAHQVQHVAGDFVDASRGQVNRLDRGFHSTLQTNPMALGAVALAVGAAVGYSLPRTQREDELMGQARDHVLEGATHVAQDAAKSLHSVAGEARDAAKEALHSATT